MKLMIKKATIRRRALIIQNPGDITLFAEGVITDVRNMRSFLTSNAGGAWDEDEIKVLPISATNNDIKEYFATLRGNCDYQFILFAGHGCYDPNYGPIYSLQNGDRFNHKWLENLVEDIPTLFIADSCQVVEKLNEGGRIARRMFSTVSDNTRRVKYRLAYDSILKELPQGMFVTASSTSTGEEAADDIKGGLYTRSLLKVCSDITKDPDAKKGVYGIGYINNLASDLVIKHSKGKQHPDLYGYTRSHQPPFLVKL